MIRQLFSFDRLITPPIIRFLCYAITVFWVLVAIAGVLAGLARMFSNFFAGIGIILGMLAVSGFFILLNRIIAELSLVVFMIRDELAWQRERQSAPGVAGPPAGPQTQA